MVSLRISTRSELAIFDLIDRQEHASNFITQIGLKAHQEMYDNALATYLSIENKNIETSGYILLMHEPEKRSVELRRISVDQAKRGVGQIAMIEVEKFCKRNFGAQRIWLDVYEDNAVGRHIYEKLGYEQFSLERRDERNLLFYEKAI